MSKKSKLFHTIVSLIVFPFILFKLVWHKWNCYFIFPSWQIGGGERVHVDILKAFKIFKPVCIITDVQYDKGIKTDFRNNALMIYLWRWGTKKSFRKTMLKVLSKIINRNPNAFVFGSNNVFFYDLIPYLSPQVRIVDLTHSITPDRNWCEVLSLKTVDRFYKRIVLGEAALQAFRQIYSEHNISPSYASHFQIIKNKVDSPSSVLEKSSETGLEIIFVARNSSEKRPRLVFEIARICKEKGLKTNFTIIGNFEEDYQMYADFVHFAGTIRNKDVLNRYYKKAHLILITSIFEGFPMVLLEGMAYGAVPISTAVGEIPYYVSEKLETGFLVENDIDDLLVTRFVSIIEEISNNPELLRNFSLNAMKLVRNNFSEALFEKSYIELLKN